MNKNLNREDWDRLSEIQEELCELMSEARKLIASADNQRVTDSFEGFGAKSFKHACEYTTNGYGLVNALNDLEPFEEDEGEENE